MEIYCALIFIVSTVYGVGSYSRSGSMDGMDEVCDYALDNASGCSVCTTRHSVEVKHCFRLQTLNEYVHRRNVTVQDVYYLKMSAMEINDCDWKISKSFFLGCHFLLNLSMTDSKVMHIFEDAFDDLSYLEFVDLRDNCIASLPQQLFRPTVKLKRLSLAGNKITMLPDSLFEFTAKLKHLDLSYNLLKEISSTELFRRTKGLQTLNLEGNMLHTIGPSSFNELKLLQELNLSHNQLSFPYFSTCGNKSIISESLSNDSIQMRIWLVNMGLKSDNAVIDLRYNDINGIPLGGFNRTCNHDRCNKITLLLANNPLLCGCYTYDLAQYYRRQWPEKVIHAVNITEDLNCTYLTTRESKPLSAIDPAEIFCSQRDCRNCPPNCTCDTYMHNNTVIVKCIGTPLTNIPELLPVSDENESELWLGRTELQNFNLIPKVATVNVLSLPHNNISKLPANFMGLRRLKVLELNDNHLEIFDELQIKFMKYCNLTRLTLGNNPWNCDDCKIIHLANFLQKDMNKTQVIDADNITCRGSKLLVRLVEVNPRCHRTSDSSSSVYIIFPVLILILLLVLLLSVKLYVWRKTEMKVFNSLPLFDNSEWALKMYDAFISYSHEDESYVAELLRKLEQRSDPFKICLHSRDWTPGEFIVKQMTDSVGRSRNTIIILSPAYFRSKWCHSEFRIALTEKLVGGNHKIIVIWFSDEEPNDCEMSSDFRVYFHTCTYLKYNDQYFLTKLESAIGRQQIKRNESRI